MFHVSDWFPTILSMANISYIPGKKLELDGFDQYPNLQSTILKSPRQYMLYNYYYKVGAKDFDLWINGTAAIRDSRYKLMHTFTSANTKW